MDTPVPRTKAAVRRRSSRLPKSFLATVVSIESGDIIPFNEIIIQRPVPSVGDIVSLPVNDEVRHKGPSRDVCR